MIIDRMDNHVFYNSLHSGIARAFSALSQLSLASMEPGRYELEGDDVFLLVQEYDAKPASSGRWEGHRRYLDIQHIIDGEEAMGYAHISTMQPQAPYDAQKDIQFFDGQGDLIVLRKGFFGLFMPEDIHMPGLQTEHPSRVRKAVVKVRI